jgi:uncharacterized membrane protein YccC
VRPPQPRAIEVRDAGYLTGTHVLGYLIARKPRDVPVRVALRNAVGVVAPLAIGYWSGHVDIGLAVATGALNTMFTDQPGPYRLRARWMLMAALAAGLSALLGILIGGHSPGFVGATLVFGFAGGMLVSLGPMAARVGLTSLIVMMVTADMRLATASAPGVAALISAGGLLQMLLAIAAWPLQRYRPERFALADLLQQLADTARSRPDAAIRPPVSQAALETLVMLHGDHRARGAAMQSFRIVAEICERVRMDLLALSDLHARIEDVAARQRLETVLDDAASSLHALSEFVRSGQPEAPPQSTVEAVEAGVRALGDAIAATRPRSDARLLRIARTRADSLAGQLRALLRNARLASSRGEIQAQLSEVRLPRALRPGAPLETLRANFDGRSVAFRHAVRSALCVGFAAACERALAIPHGVWIPMTAAIVLKPDFGGTLRFGVLRTAGTFAGLLLTTVIAHYAMHGATLRLLLMGVLCMGFRLLATVNYAAGVAMLTGMLVLLLSFTGIAPVDAVNARLVATLLGSALALGAYALWPTWEGRRVGANLGQLIDAYRKHLSAVCSGSIASLVDSRAAARRARTNAQASLERLHAEPARRASGGELKKAESILANASRLIRATVMLEALVRDGAQLPGGDQMSAFARQADAILGGIAEALREDRSVELPLLRPTERRLHAVLLPLVDHDDPVATAMDDACDRIADSVDTLAYLLRPGERGTTAAAAVAVAG